MQQTNLTSNKKIALLATFLSAMFLFTAQAFAQPGSLDPSFGDGGKVLSNIIGSSDIGYSVAIQTDGKLVVAGLAYDQSAPNTNNFGLIRFLSDGRVDSTFGETGKKMTDFFGGNDRAYSVAIQKDGKIIAAGYCFDPAVGYCAGLARYKSNGELDSTFGTNGLVSTSIGLCYGYSVLIQSDEKIIAVVDHDSSVHDFALFRYKPNGILDSSFGIDGIAKVAVGRARSGTIQPDGKIIVCGYALNNSDNLYDFALARFKNNGELDSAFGINGIVTTDFGGDDWAYSVALQLDEKIVVSGYNFVNSVSDNFAVAKYKNNGDLDSTFGLNGTQTTFFHADRTHPNSVTIQSDNKIIVVGNDNEGSFSNFAIVRYLTNGNPDSSFGTDGIVLTDFGGVRDDFAHSIAAQEDGKIIVAGSGFNGLISGFAVARYNITGNLPIHLLAFTATKQKASVLLNWQTASEMNNAYFSIERSNNGNNFSEIGKVNSKGTSNQLQEYSFTDGQPFNGQNYYRLQQVDNDGKYTYSKVVGVDFPATLIYRLYPNPAKDILHLDGLNATANTSVSLIASDGHMIDKKIISASSYDWNTKYLATGTYYLRIEENKKVTTLKFIKQ